MRPGDAYSPREILLAAAAQAVLAALRGPIEERRLSGRAIATLRVLETTLEPYRTEPPPSPPAPRGK